MCDAINIISDLIIGVMFNCLVIVNKDKRDVLTASIFPILTGDQVYNKTLEIKISSKTFGSHVLDYHRVPGAGSERPAFH